MRKTLWIVTPILLALFSACTPAKPAEPTIDNKTGLITWPRAWRPNKPVCSVTASISRGKTNEFAKKNGFTLSLGDVDLKSPSSLKSQSITGLNDDVLDTLNFVRGLTNYYYYGFSTVNLDSVHQKWATKALATCGNNLQGCALTSTTDVMMGSYIADINDDHTFYLDPVSWANENAVGSGSSTPVPVFGFQFDLPYSPDGANKLDGAIVTSLRNDGPLYLAGLRRGDLIVSVDGVALTQKAKASDTFSAYGKILYDARTKASSAEFVYSRKGVQSTVTVEAINLVAGSLPWGEARQTAGGGKYFYIFIPDFATPGMSQKIHDLVAVAKSQSMDKIVIDLRENPGGYVSEVLESVHAFSRTSDSMKYEDISADDTTFRFQGDNLQEVTTCGYTATYPAVNSPQFFEGKIALLVDQWSASGGEIFPTLLKQGLPSAKIIGVPTYGVMNTSTAHIELPGDRGFSLTLSRAVMPNNSYFPERISPDLSANNDLYQLALGNDLGISAAEQFLFQ